MQTYADIIGVPLYVVTSPEQMMDAMRRCAGSAVTLIDTDIDMIDVAQRFGAKVYFGDGRRLDLLRQAGCSDAQIIAFCIDGEQLDDGFLRAVQTAFPQAAIYARVYDRRSLLKLKDSPASFIVREVLGSAVTLSRAILDGLGLSIDDIDRAEGTYRRMDKERLSLQHEARDLRVAHDRIITEPLHLGRGGEAPQGTE